MDWTWKEISNNINETKYNQIILILENLSCYRRLQTWVKFQEWKYKIMFPPAYSPSLALVEMTFSFFKQVLKQK